MKGYVQVYTGNGKGKTTAAIGLTIRAIGAGLKVYVAQFIKNGEYSEIKALKQFKNVKIEQFGRGCLIKGKPDFKDIKLAKNGIRKVKDIILSNKFDIVILDEANVAVLLGILDEDDIIQVIKEKPENVELIITGRGKLEKVIELADLVTEMKEIKHYYNKNVEARTGIEK